jgi:hypothetical protein
MSTTDPKENRRHARITRPFDGNWRGASGASRCRISDLSLGGCYVQSLASPTAGEQTVVTIRFGNEQSLSLTGKVVYVDAAMGFAVEFILVTAEVAEQLELLIEELRRQPSDG